MTIWRSAGKAGFVRCPAFLFGSNNWSASPYINHFLQPDSMIPDASNPQSWNRYSYTGNNPVGYSDPTGHMRTDENGSSRSGCSDPKYCQGRDPDGNLKIKHNNDGENSGARDRCKTDPGLCGGTAYIHEGDPLNIFGGDTIFWGYGGDLVSWDGTKQIDPKEWDALLGYVGNEVDHSWIKTGWFDTPLFDGFGFLSGKACINPGKCYDRSELNYIGEGEALAALGLSKEGTQNVVWAWKNKGPFVFGLLGLDSTPKEVSQGTYEMTDIGWDYYHDHYLSP